MDWAGDFTKSCGRKKKEKKERKKIFYKEIGYLSPAGRSSSHSRTACSPTWIEKFYILYRGTNKIHFTIYMGDKYSIFYTLFWGQIQHNYTLHIWGSNAIYFTLYMRDKHNIFYAFFGGQMLYILRSIWGTDAIYFPLDMMDKHNIFYALFDVYSVFKTSSEYYYCTVMTK